MDEALTLLAHVSVLLALAIPFVVASRRRFRVSWFVVALALYVFYDLLLTRGIGVVPNFPPESSWNWLGKVLALAGTLIVASLPAFGFKRCGLTLAQKPGSASAWVVLGLLCAVYFYMAISGADGRDNWETIAFQWTMPGLDEELFYRGLLLLAMNEAFRGRVSIAGAPIGYGGLLTCVLFGLVHGLSYDAGTCDINTGMFLVTGVPSLILLWLREKTGSVVMPVIAHNVANGAFTLF